MLRNKRKIGDDTLDHPRGHRNLRLGFLLIAGFIFLLFLWSILVKIDSAAVASGKIDVASEVKVIQHLEGGIVEEILVEEGQDVEEGQLLLSLIDNEHYSRVQLLEYRFYYLKATLDRLAAYGKELEEPQFSEDLLKVREDDQVAKILESQRDRYISDRESFLGQMTILERKSEEIRALIASIEKQIEALNEQIRLVISEVEGLIILEQEQLVGKPVLLALQRRHEELRRQREELVGNIAQAKERISLAELQGVQLREERESEQAEEEDQIFRSMLETMEELAVAKERLLRMDIRSPVKGKVVNLSQHTIGGVVSRGDKLMEIVPILDTLVIDAKINPLDIDVVRPGLEAKVQLLPYSQRATLNLKGVVTHVSANVIIDTATQEAFYHAKIEISGDEVKDEGVELYPGMPVQVMILTGKRTPIEYLLQPIRDSFRRSFLES
jgi:HlyD family secretion protein/epimerase transport system membrane fusion protein